MCRSLRWVMGVEKQAVTAVASRDVQCGIQEEGGCAGNDYTYGRWIVGGWVGRIPVKRHKPPISETW